MLYFSVGEWKRGFYIEWDITSDMKVAKVVHSSMDMLIFFLLRSFLCIKSHFWLLFHVFSLFCCRCFNNFTYLWNVFGTLYDIFICYSVPAKKQDGVNCLCPLAKSLENFWVGRVNISAHLVQMMYVFWCLPSKGQHTQVWGYSYRLLLRVVFQSLR